MDVREVGEKQKHVGTFEISEDIFQERVWLKRTAALKRT